MGNTKKNEDFLKELYSILEKKTDLEELDYKDIHSATLSDQEKTTFQKEWWILSDYATRCENVNGQDEIIQYGKKRIASTSNIFLLARYNHVLYNLTKDGDYCKSAVAFYVLIFKKYVSKNDKKVSCDIHLVLNDIIQLSKRTKISLSPIENLVIAFLKSTDIIDETKRWILVSVKENYSKWKVKGIEFVPELCLEMFSHVSEYGECLTILEIGEYFARKFKKALLPVFYEKMGDNEEKNVYKYDGQIENMVLPHYNQNTYQKMMQYYQKAGNAEKLRYATTKYNENKVGMRFLRIEGKRELPKEFTETLNTLFETVKNSKPEQILYFLSNHCPLFALPHSVLEEKWKEVEKHKPFYMENMAAIRSDINNNTVHVTHEDNWKFQYMNICFTNSIRWIIHIISSTIERKQLSYSIVRRILLRYTNFGEEIKVYRNGTPFHYRLFDKVDIAFKDFFKQYLKEMNSKDVDWRNVINSLSIQFEGILRDTIRMYNGETSKIIGSNKENVAEMLLDDLLRTQACKRLYSDEDRDLFYYTFTSKGLNIRNNVAHGFYLPQDYTSYKAILVFLCVLRLTRYESSN